MDEEDDPVIAKLGPAEKASAKLRREAKKHLIAKQWQLAANTATEALALTPNSHKAHRLRALAYAGLSEHAAALRDVDAVLRALPNCSDAWYQKGYAHFHLQHLSESAAAFKRGLELSPADRMMRQGFWDAMSLLSQRRGDAAALAAASTDGSDVPRLGEVVDAAVIATRSVHRAGAAAF